MFSYNGIIKEQVHRNLTDKKLYYCHSRQALYVVVVVRSKKDILE